MRVAVGLLWLTVVGVSAWAQPPAGAWGCYQDAEGMTRELKKLAQANPHLVKLQSLGKSVEQRDIWLVTISREGEGREQPEVLMQGAMHGGEVIGSESLLAYARFLVEGYQTDPRARRIVDGVRTYLIPMVNPDGVEAAKTARSWDSARLNAHGVNLYRNFERGAQAFSEPESRAVRDFVRAHRLAVYVDCHAGENREPHIVTPMQSGDGRYNEIATKIELSVGFTRARGGGALSWMNANSVGHGLVFALEIYSDAAAANWWSRRNPGAGEVASYVNRARVALMTITEMGTRS